MGRGSSVGIATRYGLDGPGIEFRWGRVSAPVQTGLGAHSASYTMGTGSLPGVKRPGRGADHPSPSSAEVEGRVELYIYIYIYLGMILRSYLNWVNQVNYIAQKARKALHFVMRVLKKGGRNTKSLAYTSLVRPVLEYGSACWDPCRGQEMR